MTYKTCNREGCGGEVATDKRNGELVCQRCAKIQRGEVKTTYRQLLQAQRYLAMLAEFGADVLDLLENGATVDAIAELASARCLGVVFEGDDFQVISPVVFKEADQE